MDHGGMDGWKQAASTLLTITLENEMPENQHEYFNCNDCVQGIGRIPRLAGLVCFTTFHVPQMTQLKTCNLLASQTDAFSSPYLLLACI